MKRLVLAIAVCVSAASAAWSQQPGGAKPALKAPPASSMSQVPMSQMTPTPDMWFYDQAARQYANPSTGVRKKAEFDMKQRQHRLASCAWFGVSNARPNAHITPLMGSYGPTWVSNPRYPLLWSSQTTSTTVIAPASRTGTAQYGLW